MTRLPQPRYIGDGVYASHDGCQFILETSDGITVGNRIGMEQNTLDGLQGYIEYTREFYRNNQHRTGPGCEQCGRDISDPKNPVTGAIRAEVYHIDHNGARHEVRICPDCARKASGETLQSIVLGRTEEAGT